MHPIPIPESRPNNMMKMLPIPIPESRPNNIMKMLPIPIPESRPNNMMKMLPIPIPESRPNNMMKMLPIPIPESRPNNMMKMLPIPIPESRPNNIMKILPIPIPESRPNNIMKMLPIPIPESMPNNIMKMLPIPIPESRPNNMMKMLPIPLPESRPNNIMKMLPMAGSKVPPGADIPPVTPFKIVESQTTARSPGLLQAYLGSHVHFILSCLACYNGQLGVDCVTFSNISEIPVATCGQHQNFCKVRRLDTEGELTSLDRGCDDQCKPGCTDTELYLECVSCCTEHLCNTDNLAISMHSYLACWSWVTIGLLLPKFG
ncbi:hypothetical protein Btru_070923 [Bulinus truncatus]|nr:hypothetical protein Btru_070923 [Bulinus truncatus]